MVPDFRRFSKKLVLKRQVAFKEIFDFLFIIADKDEIKKRRNEMMMILR